MTITLKISSMNRTTQQTIRRGKSSVVNLPFMTVSPVCFIRLLSLNSRRTYGKRTVQESRSRKQMQICRANRLMLYLSMLLVSTYVISFKVLLLLLLSNVLTTNVMYDACKHVNRPLYIISIITIPKIHPILILILILILLLILIFLSPPQPLPCTPLHISLSPPSSVRRAPLLRLEFTCLTRGDLSAVKAYFEKFANFNFPRQQIHYPRCYGLWLKEISAQKVKKQTNTI